MRKKFLSAVLNTNQSVNKFVIEMQIFFLPCSDGSLNKDQVMTDEEDVKSDSEKSTASLETSTKRKA